MRRVGFGSRSEVAVLPGDVGAISQGRRQGALPTAGRILFNDALQPEVCDSPAERAASRPTAREATEGRKPRYGKRVLSILAAVWEAAGYPWSVRLKGLLPNWMPWIGKRYRLSSKIEKPQ